MLNVVANLENKKKMELFVDNCQLQNPEEVNRLFEEYTLLIWDYLMVGRINDFYTDDIVLHFAGGDSVVGVHNVFANTLNVIANVPMDNQTVFLDIFAEGNPEEGYRFIQTTSCYYSGDFGGQPYAAPEGCVYDDTMIGGIGMCECLVKKVEGKWKIVSEWLLRTVPPIQEPVGDSPS